ncbi:CBS and transporter associated domain-containing protein [Dorcoceras hygrometricum]|uniref:CBS and transporter associated domain-containing protein n=1 Tax=Dorcoceras hygrometricum TaxID=472368 RepID=A0A2Z7BGX9_9LAMI|nr:CBS and transporter associated domain-containing protein [Dorcoceras hygrometricum]
MRELMTSMRKDHSRAGNNNCNATFNTRQLAGCISLEGKKEKTYCKQNSLEKRTGHERKNYLEEKKTAYGLRIASGKEKQIMIVQQLRVKNQLTVGWSTQIRNSQPKSIQIREVNQITSRPDKETNSEGKTDAVDTQSTSLAPGELLETPINKHMQLLNTTLRIFRTAFKQPVRYRLKL